MIQKQSFLDRLNKRLTRPALKVEPVPIKLDSLPLDTRIEENVGIKPCGRALPLSTRMRSPPVLDDTISTPNDFDGNPAPLYNLVQSPVVHAGYGFTSTPAGSVQGGVLVATPSTVSPSTATSSLPTPDIEKVMFHRGSSSDSSDSAVSQEQCTWPVNAREFVPEAVSFRPPTPQPPETPLRMRTSRKCNDATASLKGEKRTTLMLRNLPNDYTRDMLLDLLDCQGFCGVYDFIYLPIDFNRLAGLGYAFVNCVSPATAEAMREQLQGFDQWCVSSQKVCDVCWGDPLQGLEAHVERYRNSPVMHQSVPDEYKPAVFVNGIRSAFPSPTKRIRTLKKHIPLSP